MQRPSSARTMRCSKLWRCSAMLRRQDCMHDHNCHVVGVIPCCGSSPALCEYWSIVGVLPQCGRTHTFIVGLFPHVRVLPQCRGTPTMCQYSHCVWTPTVGAFPECRSSHIVGVLPCCGRVLPHSGRPSTMWEYSSTVGVVSQCGCTSTMKTYSHNV